MRRSTGSQCGLILQRRHCTHTVVTDEREDCSVTCLRVKHRHFKNDHSYQLIIILRLTARAASPKGGWGCLHDVSLLSWISGLLFDTPFLSPLLLFFLPIVLLLFLSCYFSADGPFSWLFSLQKTLKYFSLRVRLFCMALVEQLGDDGRWYVQLAAVWHWYLPLCIYIKKKPTLYCVCPFLFLIFFFNLVLIN